MERETQGSQQVRTRTLKRCGSAVNELTIKPQDEKESQLFWNYGAMTA